MLYTVLLSLVFFLISAHFPSLLTFVSKIGARFLPLSRHLKFLNDTSIEIIKSRRGQNDDEKVW